MNAYAVGPVPAAIERVKTVTILADAENISLIFGPDCDEGGTSAELASPAADALLDSGSTAVLSGSDVGVNDSIGAEIEIAKPPIRRRRPRHGLGDLSSIDTNEVRKFRENVSQAPAQLVAENTKAADIARLRSYEERVRDYAKLAAQKRLKKERIALAEMASTLPSSDVVTILTRATSSGMPLAEVPLFEHLALSPDDVIENANEATRFWGGAVAIGQYNHDINMVIRRFQLGAPKWLFIRRKTLQIICICCQVILIPWPTQFWPNVTLKLALVFVRPNPLTVSLPRYVRRENNLCS